MTAARWRVGQKYGIHLYEIGPTSPSDDRPIATFHTAADAALAVDAVNRTSAAAAETRAVHAEIQVAALIRNCREHHGGDGL